MNKGILFIALSILTVSASAQQRSENEMCTIANSCFSTLNNSRGSHVKRVAINSNSITLKRYALSSSLTKHASKDNEAFAVYTPNEGKGFVIVSANEQMPEVLAASSDCEFSTNGIENLAMNELLESYAEASQLISTGAATAEQIFGNTSNINGESSSTSVDPLLGDIAFSQSYPYNNLCPKYYGKSTITGCVATSMAQLMKYYEYPTSYGMDNISYTTTSYKIKVNWNFAKTKFDWDNINDTYPCSSSTVKDNAVATLMAACGAAAESDYGISSTGAYPTVAWPSMNKYFNYDPDMYSVDNSFATTDQITEAAIDELNAGHVIPVAGYTGEDEYGNRSGHSFLIDGYNMMGTFPLFHINWGWNGIDNGYFLITQMNPDNTHNEEDNFSHQYFLYMNVTPNNNESDGLAIGSTEVNLSSTSVQPGDVISVSFDELKNMNAITNVSGKLFCYFVSNDGTAYKTSSYLYISSLQPGYYYMRSQTCNNVSIPSNIPSGTYHVELRSKDNDHFFALNYQEVTVAGETAIAEVEEENQNKNIQMFDISGRQIQHKQHGIVIMNGKKVFVK